MATKVEFSTAWFKLVHVDGTSYSFQAADLVEDFSVKCLKVGTFKRMNPAQRANLITNLSESLEAMQTHG